ncbi:MAG: DUF1684 domain-containing protein [Raineya sp.]|jgi:hypothetical protein|nr:DUF1684 domain-containing protein [Raineya sp.]
MKYILFLLCLSVSNILFAQNDKKAILKEIKAHQNELNNAYKDPEKSPLEPSDLKKFKKHDFFPINLDYRVKAKLTITETEGFFDMVTTTTRRPKYRKYGIIEFEIEGKKLQLSVYQSQDLQGKIAYKDYLFLPFKDLTNGVETYKVGRYIELSIPKEGNEIIVDFNKAYNPYCAYSNDYSCPIVPSENHLNVPIPAGIRYKKKKEDE